MKLLIVDDSTLIRETIINAYQGSVFTEIQTASDGLLAVTAFKELLPDIVTLDITMPHMDGIAALSKMLKIKANTKVLIISALADHHTAIESLTCGADQFICKPFTDEDLKEALDDILNEDESDINTHSEINNISECVVHPQIESNITASRPSAADYPSGYVESPVITS